MSSRAFRTHRRAASIVRLARIVPVGPVSLIALVALSFSLPACDGSKSSRTRLQLELAQARALWADAGLTSYAVDQRRGCFCPPPREWTVVVQNGEPAFIAAVLDPPEADRALEEFALAQSVSVDDLFDWIGQQIDGAGEIDVTYHAELGYPTSVSADPIPMAVDDEIAWTLSGLVPTGACTEIGCADALSLAIHAPPGGFPAGDWTVIVGNWDDQEQCSFTLAPGTCGGPLCVGSGAGCPVLFETPDVLVVTLPPIFGTDIAGGTPLGVLVEVDGVEVLNAAANPTETRSQPNGRLCPPVCWTAAVEVALPVPQ